MTTPRRDDRVSEDMPGDAAALPAAGPPSASAAGDVTRLLHRVRDGEPGAFDQVFAVAYDELRRIARRQLRGGHPGPLETTELVHELYLKMERQSRLDWAGRSHFFAIAARAMRQVLVDLARRRQSAKRGGEWISTTLTGELLAADPRPEDVIALDEALETLDERQRQVVELRFYAGLTEEETAEALGVSARTVQREWLKARAWLYRTLYGDATPA